MDCLEGLKQLSAESVDLVVTDPPYNIAADHRRTKQGNQIMSTKEAWGEWDSYHPFDYDLMMLTVMSECYRILKPGGSLYLFTARQDNGFFVRKAVERGFTYQNQLALLKRNPLPHFSQTNWRSAFELCLYVSKGKPKTFHFLSQAECVNVYPYPIPTKETAHPTEKPLAFIKRLIQVSSNEGELVVDPFMGSGTTAVACQQLNRQFIGFERIAEYVQMAQGRLAGFEAITPPHRRGKESGDEVLR
jgi:DNA modification methylase